VLAAGSMSKRTPLHVSEQPAAAEALALPSGRAAAKPQPSEPPEAAERFARFHAGGVPRNPSFVLCCWLVISYKTECAVCHLIDYAHDWTKRQTGFPWCAASDLVGRQIHYGKHEVFTMTHCGEGRGVGMRPPNQKAPLYAGEAGRTACVLLMRQQHLAPEEHWHALAQLPAALCRTASVMCDALEHVCHGCRQHLRAVDGALCHRHARPAAQHR
jgi:hypothetical protein